MKSESTKIGDTEDFLLDLYQRSVERRVMEDMDAGVDVYYDRRWEVTGFMAEWLEANRDIYEGKRVLILGAGVGVETVVLGKSASKLYINDLSPTALELCSEQLLKNEVLGFETLLGKYEDIDLPEVDLIVASFLVYNTETLGAMRVFMKENDCAFILMNGNLPEFMTCLSELNHELIFEAESSMCVLFKK
jgi:predicted nicotinamide N-methyase